MISTEVDEELAEQLAKVWRGVCRTCEDFPSAEKAINRIIEEPVMRMYDQKKLGGIRDKVLADLNLPAQFSDCADISGARPSKGWRQDPASETRSGPQMQEAAHRSYRVIGVPAREAA